MPQRMRAARVKTLDISELNSIYDEAELVDKETFAEQRSNILLIAGDHYTKTSSRFQNNVRNSKEISENQKIRLTKNHTHKVYRYYTDTIFSLASDVTIRPKNEKERGDVKDADLNKSVYFHLKNQLRLKEHYRNSVDDFVGLGECCSLIKFDPSMGRHVAYEQKVGPDGEPVFEPELDPATGMPAVDPMTGMPVQKPVADKDRPVFSGKFHVERVFSFNLLRKVGSTEMRKADCWIVRKMVPNKDLQAKYAGDETKLGFIDSDNKEAFIIFDTEKSTYTKSKDQTLIKEYYYPPCFDYPEGYFYIASSKGKFEEGPLPGGIFPLAWAAFDTYQTAARGKSIIKVVRPYQAEINRASSQMAMHQITVGDDKILYQSGTKLQAGALLPGVRGLTYQGLKPEILPGREGSQFAQYILQQIEEMYRVANMEEMLQDKSDGASVEPLTLLYRSAKHKKNFTAYAERFEQYLVDFVTILLELAKFYMPDDELIPAIGSSEFVNLPEFRDSQPLSHEIVVEPMDDTIESMLGRQMTFNHILQYAGQQLDKDSIGEIMQQMPYGNSKAAFADLTLNRDLVTNLILALDRGEPAQPPAPYDDNVYIVKKLTKRMTEPDYKFLAPKIQEQYDLTVQAHEQAETEKQAAIQQAQAGFIPSDGPLIGCDMYIEDKVDPTKAPKRARVPQTALNWLLEKLEAQGMNQQALEGMNQGALTEMAKMMMARQNALPPGQDQLSMLQTG
jgi:hypothetical protein